MRIAWPEKWRTNSLFARLLVSFLAIILLLAAFNFGSFLYLKGKIHDEIVKYNSLNMKHTMESYETHFKLTIDMLLSLNQNNELTANLNVLRQLPQTAGSEKTVNLHAEIKALMANPLMFYENIVFYFKNGDFVLEKEGTSRVEDMFGKFYRSPAYPPDYWRGQFAEPYFYRIHPAAVFSQKYMNLEQSLGRLIPVSVKNALYRDVLFLVFLDGDKMARTLHYSLDNPFFILDEQQKLIYASDPDAAAAAKLLTFTEDASEMKLGDHYLFQQKGKHTGFRYVTMVPIESISSELLRLNLILISLLAVTIGISVVTSVLFSVRLNYPVQRLLRTVHQYNDPGASADFRIREFELIGEQIGRMRRDLSDKNSLLRYYAFTDKLKRIHTKHPDLNDTSFIQKPFTLILFQLRFLPRFMEETSLERERATYFIREYIESYVKRSHSDALTFQIDKDQILTLAFSEHGQPVADDCLAGLKEVFDYDKDWCHFTIAVSGPSLPASEFAAAYERALMLAGERQPLEETQIIRQSAVRPPYRLTAMQEQELQTKVRSGSFEPLRQWTLQQLEALRGREATVPELRRLLQQTAGLALKAVEAAGLPLQAMPAERELLADIEQCFTYAEAQSLLERLLGQAAEAIAASSENKDPVIEFVKRYTEEHLSEDVSLDLIADKLNLSRGYVSTYFKEKTGMNFSDYLHHVRIRHAQELLLDLELKIQDIALRLGYQNVNSFIRMFKRYSGMTPGEYRKKQCGA
ncbi:hypothetical protein YDYSG_64760 [Paenibacillus tyrfis]|uniref:helix-turn-helix transcriptional regulator n=1 Tax=Paenibacillus tyrfis TaxID=1501230 RepID=UPI0024913880|nr:AraC family transcriptional regulator [Paenibacillus tyrfis]GLI10443.1 hypothetical protein YDYSG_64760 [Paenibacillus tyrfis]